MYGLLLQSAVLSLRARYGDEQWEQIRKLANIATYGFATHNIYDESIMVEMAVAASKVTGDTLDNIMDCFGVDFVNFVGQFGYDRILKVLGRHMRDFLNGLDNLHEYLRFSYPKLKPPSFFVEDETKNGLTLTYRSKRRGFLHYVKGQIRSVGKVFYNTQVDIIVVANDYNEHTQTTHVKFRLLFDNKAYREVQRHVVDNIVESIPLRPELLFELFPFHIVFSRKLEIRSLGPGLRAVLPDAVGRLLVDIFTLERPLTNFTWEDILHHTNNVFQLTNRTQLNCRNSVSIEEQQQQQQQKQQQKRKEQQQQKLKEQQQQQEEQQQSDNSKGDTPKDDETPTNVSSPLHSNSIQLKGQMMYMSEWDCIMFLGTPIMSSLDDMFQMGLYINDLSMHDSSRDLVLAGTQQSAELKLALDQEQEKSRLLEQSMIKLDQEMQRTDALLYQMIPKPVADRLRKGEPSVQTCKYFDNVTILFSDVVGFTTICSQITPMEVVSMLNAMYTQFDQLSENHSVYKVETIGDAYMAVSGAPTVTAFHALHMCDMALDMRLGMAKLTNPASNENMKIRIGIHTGPTVAGVVGIKMPRYCLFGDTVNTASRMETSGEAMKIHISETTKKELDGYPYLVEMRGSIDVKGKGPMKTYWLNGKKEIDEKQAPKCDFIHIMEEEVRTRNMEEYGAPSNIGPDMNYRRTTSSSPIPYSPVSFKDIDDKGSPVSIASSQHRLGVPDDGYGLSRSASPRGSRSGPVGCPFSMGLFGSSPLSPNLLGSSPGSPVHGQPRRSSDAAFIIRKSSDDHKPTVVFSTQFKNSNNSAHQAASSFHQPDGTGEPSSKGLSDSKQDSNTVNGLNPVVINRSNSESAVRRQPSPTYGSISSPSHKPQKPSVNASGAVITQAACPFSGGSGMSTVAENSADTPSPTSPSPPIVTKPQATASHSVTSSEAGDPTGAASGVSARPHLVGSSPTKMKRQKGDGSSLQTSPLRCPSSSPVSEASVWDGRPPSLGTLKSRKEVAFSALNNNPDTPTGNGSVGMGQVHEIHPGSPIERQSIDSKDINMLNGNHRITSGMGCMHYRKTSPSDRNKAVRKSKTCELL